MRPSASICALKQLERDLGERTLGGPRPFLRYCLALFSHCCQTYWPRSVLMTSVTDEGTSAGVQDADLSWMMKHRIALLVSSASFSIVALAAIIWSVQSPSQKTSLTRQNQGVLHSDRIRVTGTTEAVRTRAIVAPM